MKNFLIQAREETFDEVQEICERVAAIFFGRNEADVKSESGHAFMDGYRRYKPRRKSNFQDYIGQATYYHCLKERNRRAKYANRFKQFGLDETGKDVAELIPEDRAEHNVTVDDNAIWLFISKLPDDAQYVATYVLRPPRKVSKALSVIDEESPTIRKTWRKVLIRHLMQKKWTMYRINKAFDTLEKAITEVSRSSCSIMGM